MGIFQSFTAERKPNSRRAEQESAAMVSFIPEEIIIDILKRLPVKSLSRFRCVSKSWYNFIKNPHFAKLQLNHSLKFGEHGVIYKCEGKIFCVDYDSSSSTLSSRVARFDYPSEHKMRRGRIIGSCNGLVCHVSSQKDIIIWNPYTKDYKKIPSPTETDTKSRGFHVRYKYGFGYDLKSEDYKFARMTNIRAKYSEIEVYSIKLDLWKSYPDIPFLYPHEDLVFYEGIFYWVEIPRGCEDPRKIGSFDIGSEAFKEIPLPQNFPYSLFDMIHVLLLGGCLYLIGCAYMSCCEVWMMNYGIHESWTKMFTIGERGCNGAFGNMYPKQSFKNGVILVHVGCSKSYLYDPKHKEFTKFVINGCAVISTWDFVGSLVSPNNLPNSRGFESSEVNEALLIQ